MKITFFLRVALLWRVEWAVSGFPALHLPLEGTACGGSVGPPRVSLIWGVIRTDGLSTLGVSYPAALVGRWGVSVRRSR